MKIAHSMLQLSADAQWYQQQTRQQSQQMFVQGQLQATQNVQDQQQAARALSARMQVFHADGQSHASSSWVQEHAQVQRTQQVWTHSTGLAAQAFTPGEWQGAWQRFVAPSLQRQVPSTDAATASKPTMPPQLLKMVEAVEQLIEQMTGKPYRLQIYGYQDRPLAAETPAGGSVPASVARAESTNTPATFTSTANLGVQQQWQQTFQETEQLNWQAEGVVLTESGQQVRFAFSAQMQRTFFQTTAWQQSQGAVPQDPLVVNFGGQNARLSLERIAFDLNNDGQQESLPFLQAGSGFLALDRNGNGQIDQGSELFGPETGEGFGELAAYDEDGNGWIDENDSVFAQLQIWHQTAEGQKQLHGLLALNVGAIALSAIASPFTFTDAQNQPLAQMRSSSVFLQESGGVGSVQQIDLMV
ncbi:MAG: hypothetical protein JXR44_02915 [Thiotrichales bacterium]|nr:hypothetical protein [Thiotrichales bacterium]